MGNIKKVCYIPWVGTKLKDEVFEDNELGSWESALKNILAKDGIEIHTIDKLPIKDADAVIIFDNIFYKNIPYIWEMYKHKKLNNCIYIDYEPPTGHCRNHSEKGLKKLSNIFKYVITYNDDIVNNHNILKGCIGNFYSKDLEYKHDFNKRKFMTMITNPTSMEQIIGIMNYYNFSMYYNCNNFKSHPSAIYGKRIEAARYFLNKCPEDFDLYGVYWTDEFNKVLKGYLDKKEKCKTLSKYKFIISYDSMIKQNGYISEKIFDAFRAKTVPIYWGADNIEKYIPKECYIDKRDFADYDELYDFLKNMTEEDYESKIKAIEDFLQSEKYKTIFSSDASAEILKKALISERSDFSYEKAYKNLKYFERKKKKVDKYKKIQYWVSDVDSTANNIKLSFKFVNFYKPNNIEFFIKENGKIHEIKDLKITTEGDIELSDTYTFTYDIKNNNKKNKIEVIYKCNGKSIKLRTEDFSDITIKKLGLIQNKKKTKIMYYNYYGLNKRKKIIYLIIHDTKEAKRLLLLKLNNFRLMVKGKIRNNKILTSILTIIVRLIKLPFLYVKDIINVFKFEDKKG